MDLRLKGCDFLVALGDLLLVVRSVAAYFLLLLLALRLLLLLALLHLVRALRGFLAAILLTVHVMPASLRSGGHRKDDARTFTGVGIVAGRHKPACASVESTNKPTFL